MAERLLEVMNIETRYGLSQVLFGISLAISPGEMVTLMGRNGMGKTTTVRSVMGLTPAMAGSIRFAGQEIASFPSFRHQADAGLRDPKRRKTAHVMSGKTDRARVRRRQPHDGADGGGLAHAVAAHQGHHLSDVDLQRQPEQHLAQAITGLHILDLEQCISHGGSPHAGRRDRRA